MNKWTLDLSFDKPPLNLNQRMHWAKKAKITKEIRREVYIHAKADLGWPGGCWAGAG